MTLKEEIRGGYLGGAGNQASSSFQGWRSGEEATLYGLAQSLGMKVDKDKLNDPHTKAQLLLNAHFTRSPITTDLSSDQKFILEHSVRLLQGLVDVISSCGWLTPALSAMELSQMVVQATTSTSSPLMQLPHFTPAMVDKAKHRV